MKTFFCSIALAVSALSLSGCVSAKYQLANKSPAAPAALKLAAVNKPGGPIEARSIDAQVVSAIYYQSPGSWKREAAWDEYTVELTNRGSSVVVIESAALEDTSGNNFTAGADPWALEKQSQTKQAQLLRSSALEVGGTAAVAATGVFSGLTSGGAGALAGFGGMSAAASGAVLVAAPIVVTGLVANLYRRNQIEKEFARRRLSLPATVQSQKLVRGGLFFPITPHPKRLMLHTQVDDQPEVIEFDMSPVSFRGRWLPPGMAARDSERN